MRPGLVDELYLALSGEQRNAVMKARTDKSKDLEAVPLPSWVPVKLRSSSVVTRYL